ncbi:hypothetical protein KP509_34G024200 [Ceratopteris richardii]|nr:hypothetical protein KP509_34G024200 [Ceratopteris richardii]KAH7283796.1 hypothetical protein KP509_34G024200 [Ceratopteris richardii]
MQQDHLSRLYHGNSQGIQSMAGIRSETAVSIVDGQTYGSLGRGHFLAGPAREFATNSSGVLQSVDKNDGLAGESQRFVNGSSHISGSINPSSRVIAWSGGEEPRGMRNEAEYREMDDVDGGSSAGTQSDGSEEDDEDDGDMEGDTEDLESHQEVASLVDNRPSIQRNSEIIGSMQREVAAAAGQELNVGIHSKGKKEKMDPELSSCTPSSVPPVNMFLSPSSTIPFLNSLSSPPTGPVVGHVDGNAAIQNGAPLVLGSGIGASRSSHGYYKDNGEKEANLKDVHGKERTDSSSDHGGNAHSSHIPDAVPIGSAAAQCYNSLIRARAANPQRDPANQIVTFSQKKVHEPRETALRSALVDPLTGALMDDAMILLCGHSFGNESLQRVFENNACISCGAAARREDMAPNHALQMVVQAYKREEQRWKENASRAAKRRRERLEQERQSMGEIIPFDFRYKAVQFPYKVNDKVLIKGNKRTPERFVGRKAIITSQCLNGWYVVKTLDNGESVKVQYRSLMKTDEQEELQPSITAPNWL